MAGLGVSGSSSESVEVTAPSDPGTYYYGACVDTVTDESDDTNNCSSSVQIDVPEPQEQSEGYPDLTIQAVSVAASPGGTYPGGFFTLSATVRNDGDGASEATTLRYYQSTDATVTTSDTEVTTNSVGGLGDLGSTSESVELTAPSTAGTYYYGACVDAVENESDTTNNCSSSVRINVLESQNQADLIVWVRVDSNTFGTSTAGKVVTNALLIIHALAVNKGNLDSAATTLRYYQSTDATISTSDTEVDTDVIMGLPQEDSAATTNLCI